MRIWKNKFILKSLVALALASVLGASAYLFVKTTPQEVDIKRVEEPLVEEGEDVLGLNVAAGKNELIYTSEIYEAKMRFNAIALHWRENGITWKEGRRVFLRTSLDGNHWTDWLELESLGPMRDDDTAERIFPEVPLLIDGNFFQYRVIVRQDRGENSAPNLREVWVTYVDSRTPIRQKLIGAIKELIPSAQAAGEEPTIITRAGWGSPDPYGNKFKGTTKYWDPAYHPVEQIFIHHTVFYNTSDPAAAVRAVWDFHANTRGWGDIGYNYLVDQQGRIYEGRFGGDNVVAGHVYGFNQKSLGVAVLGCFDTSSSACAGAPPPSAEMMNGLTTLLAWKSANYDINPNTTQKFCGLSSCLTLWTISGHKDAGVTACPGNLIYDQLQAIRETTWNKKFSFDLSAKQLDFNLIIFSAFGEEKSVTLSFKNTGNATWSNTTNRILLKTANPDGRTSSLQGTGWVDNQTPAVLNEASVAPGGTGSFTFNFKSPSDFRGWNYETFRLSSEGVADFPQMFTTIVQAPSFRWEFQGVGHSTGSVYMNHGETQTITLKAKNTGTATWYRDTGWPVRVGTWGPSRTSLFYHNNWLSNIRPAKILEESVAPGAVGTFVFDVFVSPQAAPGWYFERFNLVAEGLVWFNDTGAGAYFNVLPSSYQWEFQGVAHSTGSVFMNPGETQTITLKAKNTGETAWYREAYWPIRLGTWGPSRTSLLYHGDWLNSIRPAKLLEESVAPGEVGTFAFNVFVPAKASPGWYFERVNLVAEGLVWLNDTGAGFYIYVLPGYRWEFGGVAHSTGSVFMNPGETQTITLWAKNTGTATWHKGTSWPVRLGTWKPSRISSLYHGSWFSNIRPALLNQTSVAPGEVGTFSFTIVAPSTPGWHFERVNLVAEGLAWLNYPNAGFYVYVR